MEDQQQASASWSGAGYGGGQAGAAGDDGQAKNLWIGELQYWMDENYLWNCFAATNDLQAVKVIRNKQTGQSEGYGFIEFGTHASAQHVVSTYPGTMMPQTEQPFRLNWAGGAGTAAVGGAGGGYGGGARPMGGAAEYSLFCGDLAHEATDQYLLEVFQGRYATVTSAKVVMDMAAMRSKGYGFVRFSSEEERDRALAEMQGQPCCNRPMRLSVATPKRTGPVGAMGGPRGPPPPYTQEPGSDDPTNTTVFVGGLDMSVSEDMLRAAFGPYGELVYVKIPLGKGCGFVQFLNRPDAEQAIHNLHGALIGTCAIRCTWGRNPSAKQKAAYQASTWQQDPSQYGGGGGGYYGAQGYGGGYDGYGAADSSYGYGGYQAQAGGYGYQQQTPPTQQPSATVGGALSGSASSFDPTQPPSVDKLNEQYMAQHEAGLGAPHMIFKASDSVAA